MSNVGDTPPQGFPVQHPPTYPTPARRPGLSNAAITALAIVTVLVIAGAAYVASPRDTAATHASVAQLEQAITKDAAKNGIGVTKTSCSQTGAGNGVTTYDCLAITETDPDGTQRGIRYSGVVDSNSQEIRWHIGG